MARRLPEILTALDRDASPLTAALRNVLEALTPQHLSWKRATVTDSTLTTCFQAVSDGTEPHLFSVNMHTGVVLFDGLPPRRLPPDVLENPM
eukprot:2622802-Pleurochrysis_carterae.AAC.1